LKCWTKTFKSDIVELSFLDALRVKAIKLNLDSFSINVFSAKRNMEDQLDQMQAELESLKQQEQKAQGKFKKI
jgi:hypothetical protein